MSLKRLSFFNFFSSSICPIFFFSLTSSFPSKLCPPNVFCRESFCLGIWASWITTEKSWLPFSWSLHFSNTCIHRSYCQPADTCTSCRLLTNLFLQPCKTCVLSCFLLSPPVPFSSVLEQRGTQRECKWDCARPLRWCFPGEEDVRSTLQPAAGSSRLMHRGRKVSY